VGFLGRSIKLSWMKISSMSKKCSIWKWNTCCIKIVWLKISFLKEGPQLASRKKEILLSFLK
jgi:hypothetical protein